MINIAKETKKDIKQIGPMETAILLLMYSTGMTIDEIINLDYGDFALSIVEYMKDPIYTADISTICEKLKDREDVIGKWDVTDPKTGRCYAFNTSRSTHAILDYLKTRNDYVFFDEPLFTDKDGNRINKSDVSSIFNQMRI